MRREPTVLRRELLVGDRDCGAAVGRVGELVDEGGGGVGSGDAGDGAGVGGGVHPVMCGASGRRSWIRGGRRGRRPVRRHQGAAGRLLRDRRRRPRRRAGLAGTVPISGAQPPMGVGGAGHACRRSRRSTRLEPCRPAPRADARLYPPGVPERSRVDARSKSEQGPGVADAAEREGRQSPALECSGFAI